MANWISFADAQIAARNKRAGRVDAPAANQKMAGAHDFSEEFLNIVHKRWGMRTMS